MELLRRTRGTKEKEAGEFFCIDRRGESKTRPEPFWTGSQRGKGKKFRSYVVSVKE